VLGPNGRPVRGLTADDFFVFEDGVLQSISGFYAFDMPDVTDTTTTWPRRIAPDVTTNAPPMGRLLVLVLDDSTVEQDGNSIGNAPKIAKSIVERLNPDDRVAIVFTRDSRYAQNFTGDRDKLLKAISHYTLGFRGMGGGGPSDTLYYSMSVNVLYELTNLLIGIPDRRKAVIYIGQGVPVDMDAAAGVAPPGIGANQREAQSALANTLRRVFERAQRANVNVYTIDTCGLRVPGRTCGSGLEVAFLQTVAGNTGGRAVVNTNDYEPGITAILEANASYYLIGYRPTNTKADGTFRKLGVVVNRPGVTVQTRQDYIAPDANKIAKAAKEPQPPPAVAALSDLLPNADLPLQVAVAPFAVPGKDSATVMIALGVRQPAIGERVLDQVELLTGTFTPEGDDRGSARETVAVTLTPPRRPGDGTRYDVLSRVDLKPGRYELRLSAHSTAFDKRGSVYVDVEVPDFAKAPVSLSGVALNAMPGVPFGPSDPVKGLIPVTPTSERTFSRIDRVSAFLRVYQGGNARLEPVTITTRIVDTRDTSKFERTETLGADRFATRRAADVPFALPLAQLVPGEYLLTFEATLGKITSRREVRFTVR
jgi:VWFA-related protein